MERFSVRGLHNFVGYNRDNMHEGLYMKYCVPYTGYIHYLYPVPFHMPPPAAAVARSACAPLVRLAVLLIVRGPVGRCLSTGKPLIR